MNFVDRVSCKDVIRYNEGAGKKVVLVDCGVKANIIRSLIKRGVEVVRVPWNYDYTDMQYDGLFLANGPGDPDVCSDVGGDAAYCERLWSGLVGNKLDAKVVPADGGCKFQFENQRVDYIFASGSVIVY